MINFLMLPIEFFSSMKNSFKSYKYLDIYRTKCTKQKKLFEANF